MEARMWSATVERDGGKDVDVDMDVETGLGEPAKTTDPEAGHDWKAEIEGRWQALGRRIFVDAAAHPPRLAEIRDECDRLASIWALVQHGGNLTGASRWVACSRRKVRVILHAWLQDEPGLIPMPLAVFVRWARGRAGQGATSDER